MRDKLIWTDKFTKKTKLFPYNLIKLYFFHLLLMRCQANAFVVVLSVTGCLLFIQDTCIDDGYGEEYLSSVIQSTI